jgi:hypothetical protein
LGCASHSENFGDAADWWPQASKSEIERRASVTTGRINTHTGLTVDGFEMVFMRIDGDRLDPADSYTSPWLGDEKGGSPRDVSSGGKIPVGLQGRAGKEIYGLGLIVERWKVSALETIASALSVTSRSGRLSIIGGHAL